jgi:hypothetical protein
LIPEPIEISSDLTNPFDLFVKSELLVFNRFVRMLKELKNTCISVVPLEWKSMIGCGCVDDVMEFIEFLKAKRDALLSLAACKIVDVCYITNLQGMFHAFLQNAAIHAESTVDMFELTFRFGVEEADSLILRGMFVVGCLFDVKQGLIKPAMRDSFIHRMPVVSCKAVVKSWGKEERFMCPLFRCLHHKNLIVDFERVDGESKNFIWYIPVVTKAGEKYLIANGVCFVCQIAGNLKTCFIE